MWVSNLQLLVSTHSSVLLSKSRLSGEGSIWHLVKQDDQPKSNPSNKWSTDEIEAIGKALGDGNFKLYFEAAIPEDQLFLEDSRQETIQAYEKMGIKVSHAIGGTGEIKNMIKALGYLDRGNRSGRIIFVIDHDKGLPTLNNLVGAKLSEISDFALHQIENLERAYFLILPNNTACEELFYELDDLLDRALNELVDKSLKLRTNPPSYLSTATIKFRKHPPKDRQVAKSLLRGDEDFKAYFWRHVSEENLKISTTNAQIIKDLINTRDVSK